MVVVVDGVACGAVAGGSALPRMPAATAGRITVVCSMIWSYTHEYEETSVGSSLWASSWEVARA